MTARRGGASSAVVVAAAFAFSTVIAATPASASTTRHCSQHLAPNPGTYSTIIERLTARGVTCRRALAIAGQVVNSGGQSVPTGWKCSSSTRSPQRCVRHHAVVTFVGGGDAG